jgi:hypothetical protein
VLVLYDFQDNFNDVSVGKFGSAHSISVRERPHTAGKVRLVEDVKTLHVYEREQRESGIYIHLPEIEGIQTGDRITVTGRIGENAPSGANWSIVLQITSGRQIAQHIAPNPIFSLSHIFFASHLLRSISVPYHFCCLLFPFFCTLTCT